MIKPLCENGFNVVFPVADIDYVKNDNDRSGIVCKEIVTCSLTGKKNQLHHIIHHISFWLTVDYVMLNYTIAKFFNKTWTKKGIYLLHVLRNCKYAVTSNFHHQLKPSL